jgi:hypothetical protein
VGKEREDNSQIGMLFRMLSEPLRKPISATNMQTMIKAMQEKMD